MKASRALTIIEGNYGITDLETLAVVQAISHFKHYLYNQHVRVYTDHTCNSKVCLYRITTYPESMPDGGQKTMEVD